MALMEWDNWRTGRYPPCKCPILRCAQQLGGTKIDSPPLKGEKNGFPKPDVPPAAFFRRIALPETAFGEDVPARSHRNRRKHNEISHWSCCQAAGNFP